MSAAVGRRIVVGMTTDARPLERALLSTLATHAIAMMAMAALLLPGMPGGPHAAVADRAAYVAGHPWLWRAGWLAFQLTAASDVLLSAALLVTPWVPRWPAALAMVATVAAVVPDQLGQAMWTWRGVHLAATDLSAYAGFETHVMRLVAAWGTVGYLSAAVCWSWAFAAAGTWSRRMTRLSVVAWSTFAVATAVLFWPGRPAWVDVVTSAGNAVAFVLLMAWLAGVTEHVLRRNRPTTAAGQWALWHHPRWPRLDGIGNSRLVHAVGRWLPFVPLVSDVTDAVYVNYLVPAERLLPLVPAGLTLQRVGPDGASAVFTVLTYRHGHFGPPWLGPLRRLCPSPVQSNWRVYVVDPTTGRTGVLFVTTAIDATLGALVARATGVNVPMHVPAGADVRRDGERVRITMKPGAGSAPDLSADLCATAAPLPSTWADGFGAWTSVLAYLVPQDRAFAVEPGTGRVVCQTITLDVPLADCRPLGGAVSSAAAAAIVGDAEPLCVGVNRVRFAYLAQVVR